MKLLVVSALLIAAVCATAQAAPWDGTKGPFAIATFTFSSGTGTNLPGVPIVAGPLVWHTTVFIRCADQTISAARVKISYRDPAGAHNVSLLADLSTGYGGVTLEIPLDQVTDAKFEELRVGATY